MSGVNKVERFVQNRNRPNIFTHQHQAASATLQDQSLRRSAIAANARVQTPVTRLHTPIPSTRIKTAPIEDLGSSFGSNERPNELRRAQTEVKDRQAATGDVFDTDFEDLTESLFSDRISIDDGQPKEQQKQASHSMDREQGGEHGTRQDNGGRPKRQDPGSSAVKNMSEEPDEAEDVDEGDSSDGSDDLQPGDDPTVTFTPEQAARLQDYSRRALQVVERPKSALQHAAHSESGRPGSQKDLYDLTGPDIQKIDKQVTRPNTQRTVPFPSQANLHGMADGNGKGSYRDRVGVPQPMVSGGDHRIEQQERPFQPSKSVQREEEDGPQPKQAGSEANMPSSGSKITSPTDMTASTPAIELDYPPDILAGMKYEELLSQPFDTNPSPPPSVLPPNHNTSLPSQLAHVLNLASNQQRQYFASLTASQWEDCGDWFVEQFTDITGKMREARKEKRKVAMALEEEIAARERLVRSKTEGFEKVLEGMKKGGQGLLGRH